MQAYRIETTLKDNHILTLSNLPFQAGETVEIIILAREVAPELSKRYPLRGTPVQYTDPTAPVAEADWGSLS
jgi:hypothetical protein